MFTNFLHLSSFPTNFDTCKRNLFLNALASIMKKTVLILSLIFFIGKVSSQNIELSHGLGKINDKFTYRKLVKVLGVPDSIYFYDPTKIKPIPKNLAQSHLFYDNNNIVFFFAYFMLDELNKKSKSPNIVIYPDSKIKLNGMLISSLDSTSVVRNFGTPERVSKYEDDNRLNYNFRDKKYFSLLTFYYDGNWKIRKVSMDFGKY